MPDPPKVDPFASPKDGAHEDIQVVPPTPVVADAAPSFLSQARDNIALTLANATAYAVRRDSSALFGNHSRSSSFIGSYPSSPTMGAQFPVGTPNGSMYRSSSAMMTGLASAATSTGVNSTAPRTAPRLRTTLLPFLLRPSSMTSLPPAQVQASDGSLVEKPWREGPSAAELSKTPFMKRIFTRKRISPLVGLGLGVLQCVLTYIDVSTERMDRQPLCLVMEEDFNGGEDAVFGSGPGGEGGSFWREVNMDGFGNGEFEMTTASSKNSYVKNGILYLAPTLTAEEIGSDNVFDYGGYYAACSATANTTAGTIVNPVQSARISTIMNARSGSGNGSTKYGRVEIRAKMPTGDWLWPALWMLPVNNTYGPWPRSGEIDIVESRGNGISYTANGANFVQGALNWGPSPQLNSVSKSYSWWSNKRVPFSSDFHTYALEWTTSFIRIYVDTRLHTLLEYRFDEPFFEKGDYPQTIVNASTGQPQALQDPWADPTTGLPKEKFYLIMNVAVGGVNGWFPDGQGNKPWYDGGADAMRSFAEAQSQWYPTWPENLDDRAMAIDYVKMWRHCDGN
ncbi:glucan 1,3-beta-glucosidase [Lentinula lateritia]|nr:glucan 1,3-beta-glucosidase [Lentinula lateritia]